MLSTSAATSSSNLTQTLLHNFTTAVPTLPVNTSAQQPGTTPELPTPADNSTSQNYSGPTTPQPPALPSSNLTVSQIMSTTAGMDRYNENISFSSSQQHVATSRESVSQTVYTSQSAAGTSTSTLTTTTTSTTTTTTGTQKLSYILLTFCRHTCRLLLSSAPRW